MAGLADFRAKYPGAYDDLSDQELGDRLYNKSYSDMPRAEFDKRMGIAPQGTIPSGTYDVAKPEVDPALAEAGEAAAAEHRKRLGLAAPKGDLLAAPKPDAPDYNRELSLADVAGGAVSNLVPSAARLGGDLWHAVTNPVETGTNLWNVGAGAVQKVIPGEQGQEKYADAVGSFFAERYGGVENLKRTMADDPVGFLADLSTVLSGGSLALARAPGVAGTVSRVAGTVGRAVDPVNAALQGAKVVGAGAGKAASAIAGLTTGTGGEAFRQAAKAGYEGGGKARAFADSMRGRSPMDDVIAEAKSGLDAIRQDRQAAYRSGMADLSQDQTVLDFKRIDQALANMPLVKTYRGKTSGVAVTLEPSAKKTAAKLDTIITRWRNLPPADFHTPEGLDALKQRIGDVMKGTKPGTASWVVAKQAYDAVKNQILAQAPRYAQTMRNYQQASDLIREIEGTLSLNRNARIDTQLRKLQSVMRNNVNTNYGQRANLVQLLEQNGARNLTARLAGQSLSSFEPRGLARVVAGIGGVGGVAAAAMNPVLAAQILAALTASSPRLMGELTYGAGALARRLPKRSTIRGTAQSLYPTRYARPETERIE